MKEIILLFLASLVISIILIIIIIPISIFLALNGKQKDIKKYLEILKDFIKK